MEVFPTITPAPDLASAAVIPSLLPRQYGCVNLDAVTTCANNGYLPCIQSVGNNYGSSLLEGYKSCYCNYGMDYLNCFYSAMTGANCPYTTGDFAFYQLDWYRSYCGTIPPSAMARITPPTSVSISFTTVRTTRLSTISTPPARTAPPIYTGVGELLGGKCSSTSYTLVDAGSTVYWAGFVGCISDRPECCPWKAAETKLAQAAADAAATTTANGAAGGMNTQGMGGAFPSPQDAGQLLLKSCAEDYYSISGGCCPNGYFPFTSGVGGQTPCWSSTNRMSVPTLTQGILGQPTDTSKPTSAVVNIVWAVKYPVQGSSSSSSSTLSTAAIAGISAGAGIGVLALAVAIFFVFRAKRRSAAKAGAVAGAGMAVGEKAQGSMQVVQNVPPPLPLQTGKPPGYPGLQELPPGAVYIPPQGPFVPNSQPMPELTGTNNLAPYQQWSPAATAVGGQVNQTPPPAMHPQWTGGGPLPQNPSELGSASPSARYSHSVVSHSELSSLSGATATALVPQGTGNSGAGPHGPYYYGQGGGGSPQMTIAEADEGRVGYAVSAQQQRATGGRGYMGEEMYAEPPPGPQQQQRPQGHGSPPPPPGA